MKGGCGALPRLPARAAIPPPLRHRVRRLRLGSNRELADPPTLVRMREPIPDDDDIKLGDYLHVLWVRRWLVLGCAIVGTFR